MRWVELAVYVTGWFIGGRVMLHAIAGDGPLRGEDRLAAGFLPLFWPLALVVLAIAGVLLLPSLRWRKVSAAGERAGWVLARRHGVGAAGRSRAVRR